METTPRSEAQQPRHFIPYGSYFAPCDYITDMRFPERETERRCEVTCAACQSRMTDLGDLPEPVHQNGSAT